MTYPTEFTWGDRLALTVRKRGGLAAAWRRISSQVGPHLGSRTTFAELFDLDDPPTDDVVSLRAWTLLTTIGENPSDWGLPTEGVLPPAFEPDRVRDLLSAPSAWFTAADALCDETEFRTCDSPLLVG